jgi:hypothetical protein
MQLPGYKLNLTAPVTAEQGKINYISIAMAGASADKTLDASVANEIIFGRYLRQPERRCASDRFEQRPKRLSQLGWQHADRFAGG